MKAKLKGFTLIELLIAVFLTVTVIGAGYYALNYIRLRSRNYEARSSEYMESTLFVKKLTEDFLTASSVRKSGDYGIDIQISGNAREYRFDKDKVSIIRDLDTLIYSLEVTNLSMDTFSLASKTWVKSIMLGYKLNGRQRELSLVRHSGPINY